ncbi:complex III assembly factor LYRM7 isoform X3 [Phyllopteryx taeniolatus]|nr:complex III assembly factor LYRM7 isoform X3 [Phyllopteryx taeniolatus]
MAVFKDDERALAAAKSKINEEFRKNKHESSEENIEKMIKMGSDVETVLREGVVQMEHVGNKRLRESMFPFCFFLQTAFSVHFFFSQCFEQEKVFY